MNDPLLLQVDGGLARLTLNRPHRLNAFDAELAQAWAEATAHVVARDDVRAIVLDAAGPAFCAGGDVIAMARTMSSGAELERFAGVINLGIRALVESSIPVVAAAHGTTAGGGLGILLSSDYAIVGADSRLGSRYANVGLTPDLSVSAQLARAVGERRALALLLQDRMLSAHEAREWGLVAEVVEGPKASERAERTDAGADVAGMPDAVGPGAAAEAVGGPDAGADVAGRPDAAAEAAAIADAVRARATEVARGWLAGASGAYGQAKRLVRSRPQRTFAEQLAEEARTIGAAFDTVDAQARIAAFAAASRTPTATPATPAAPGTPAAPATPVAPGAPRAPRDRANGATRGPQ